MKKYITEIGAWHIMLATKTTNVDKKFRMYPEVGLVPKAPDAPLLDIASQACLM
jgi:hypothetical protein